MKKAIRIGIVLVCVAVGFQSADGSTYVKTGEDSRQEIKKKLSKQFGIIKGKFQSLDQRVASLEERVERASPWKWESELSIRNYSYFERPAADQINTRSILGLNLGFEAKPQNWIAVKSHVKLRNDLNDESYYHFRFGETYAHLMGEDLNVKFGNQIFSWGSASLINPTDNLNPVDYSDFIDVEKIAVLAAYLDYHVKMLRFEYAVIPSLQQSVFPSPASRWGFLTGVGAGAAAVAVVPSRKDDSLKHGARMSMYTGLLDASVSYVHGYNQIPKMAFSPTTGLEMDYYLVDIFGLDLASTVRSLGLHVEGAVCLTPDMDGKDPLVDDPYIFLVGGFDRKFSFSMLRTDVVLSMDYAYKEFLVDGQRTAGTFSTLFKHMVAFNLETTTADRYLFDLKGSYEVSKQNYLARVQLGYQPVDDFVIRCGIDLFAVSENSVFKAADKNDRFFLTITYNL